MVAGPNGQPVCGPVATNPYFNAQPAIVRTQLIANLSPGCVPYNIFGTNKAANQGALNYASTLASQSDFQFRQYVATANLAGEPFQLPAGPLSIAIGAEWRKEKLSSVNCPDCQKGALMNQNYSLFSGEVTVKEAYGEIGVPVLKDVPFVKSLDFNGGRAAHRLFDLGRGDHLEGRRHLGHQRRHPPARHPLARHPGAQHQRAVQPRLEGNPNINNRANNVSGFTKSNTIGNPNLKPETGEHLHRRLRAAADLGLGVAASGSRSTTTRSASTT